MSTTTVVASSRLASKVERTNSIISKSISRRCCKEQKALWMNFLYSLN